MANIRQDEDPNDFILEDEGEWVWITVGGTVSLCIRIVEEEEGGGHVRVEGFRKGKEMDSPIDEMAVPL